MRGINTKGCREYNKQLIDENCTKLYLPKIEYIYIDFNVVDIYCLQK
jgi:hypothetical protein